MRPLSRDKSTRKELSDDGKASPISRSTTFAMGALSECDGPLDHIAEFVVGDIDDDFVAQPQGLGLEPHHSMATSSLTPFRAVCHDIVHCSARVLASAAGWGSPITDG